MFFDELNDKLGKAKEALWQKKRLESEMVMLQEALAKEQEKKAEMEAALVYEELDVRQLEGLSLKNLVCTVLGTKYEKLDKERQDVLAVALKLENCNKAIQYQQNALEGVRVKLEGLADAEVKYQEALRLKEKTILEQGGQGSGRLVQLKDEADDIRLKGKEVWEAVQAGEIVIGHMEQALDELKKAEGWGTWDMLGGGFIATAAKHDHMEAANRYIGQAKYALDIFRRELRDIRIGSEVFLELGSFDEFGDFFLDGLFFDWVVQNKIESSMNHVGDALRELLLTVGKLDQEHRKLMDGFKRKEEEIRALIEEAGL